MKKAMTRANALVAIMLMVGFAGAAQAGSTGAEWNSAVTFFTNGLTGGYGRMAALACLAWGIWGVFSRSVINILLPIVVALAVTVGPTIVNGIVTATI